MLSCIKITATLLLRHPNERGLESTEASQGGSELAAQLPHAHTTQLVCFTTTKSPPSTPNYQADNYSPTTFKRKFEGALTLSSSRLRDCSTLRMLSVVGTHWKGDFNSHCTMRVRVPHLRLKQQNKNPEQSPPVVQEQGLPPRGWLSNKAEKSSWACCCGQLCFVMLSNAQGLGVSRDHQTQNLLMA